MKSSHNSALKHNRLLTYTAALVAVISSSSALAGTIYFDYNNNSLINEDRSSVFLFGDAGQTATVSNLAGFNTNVVLNSDGFFNLDIPVTYMQSGTGITNTGFRVDSDQSIAGYFVNRRSATTDMTYLFDESSLGTDYVVASQGNGFGEGSQMAVHATVDGTTVTINPQGAASFDVVLNAGETYTYAGGTTNLTGSSISADNPVAVFSGHECAQVPSGTNYCDTLIEQMIPVDRLSSSYLVTASSGANVTPLGHDLIRVIATEDGTDVTVGGVMVATLNEGEYYEFELPADSGEAITTSAPTLVAQYLTGGQNSNTDPAMSVVPGIDTWLDDYRLATPDGGQAFTLNYASVVLNTADLASLMLDGVAVDTSGFTTIAGTLFSQGIVNLPLGLFNLEAASDFLVMLGGGADDDSYFTFGGATFAPGVSPQDPDPQNPIPEPAGIAMLGLGILALRRFQRK